MVSKKKSKNVLDYDPLAWLDESGEDVKSTQNNVSGNNMDELGNSIAEGESPAFGFFTDKSESKPMDAVETITETTVEPENESQGSGFFNDSRAASSVQSAEHDDSSHIIDLGAELTIRSVSNCKAMIDKRIRDGFDIKLAAGDLQKIDSAGLQMIYSLLKTMEKNLQPVQWVSRNSMINQSARLMGMQNLLDSDEETAFGFFDDAGSATPDDQQESSAFGFF